VRAMNHKIEKARDLRLNQTLAEKIIWGRLRNKQICDLKFRRQYNIGSYFVDFCCIEISLIIEIDGDVHGYEERKERDRFREDFLKNSGFKIVRYTNYEIYNNLDGVLENLFNLCEALKIKKSDN
jgi:very-short-patch-repair endonuclease